MIGKINSGQYFILDIGGGKYIPLRAVRQSEVRVDYSPAYENNTAPLAPTYLSSPPTGYSANYIKRFSFKMAQVTPQGVSAPDLFNMSVAANIVQNDEIFEVGIGIAPSPLRLFYEYPQNVEHGEYSPASGADIVWGSTYGVYDFGYIDGFINPLDNPSKFIYFVPNISPNFLLYNPTSAPLTPYFDLYVNRVKVQVPPMSIILKMFSGQPVNGIDVAPIYQVSARESPIVWSQGALGVSDGVSLYASQSEIQSKLGVIQ